jgi:hypothetical protein
LYRPLFQNIENRASLYSKSPPALFATALLESYHKKLNFLTIRRTRIIAFRVGRGDHVACTDDSHLPRRAD